MAVLCTPQSKTKLNLEVFMQLLGRFLTTLMHLMKICIRGQCEIFNFFTKARFRKARGVESRLYKDFQQVDEGCRKFAKKLPIHLKFQFDFGCVGLRASYGPQVVVEK